MSPQFLADAAPHESRRYRTLWTWRRCVRLCLPAR